MFLRELCKSCEDNILTFVHDLFTARFLHESELFLLSKQFSFEPTSRDGKSAMRGTKAGAEGPPRITADYTS
jgi:hypothetical protein